MRGGHRKKEHTTTVPRRHIAKLHKLQIHRPKDRTWLIIKIVVGITSGLLIVFDVLIFYVWITEPINAPLDIASIAFLVFIVGLPVYSLVDITRVERRIRRIGRSWVYYSAEIDLEGNFDKLLERCRISLENMGARVYFYDAQSKLIKADIGNNEMTVRIRGVRGVRKRILITSDSKLLSVRFDFGQNCRNVETLLSKLLT
ncbi:hypothetical protein ES703_119218 [subsurface metagenome]